MKNNNSIIHVVQYYETDQMGVVHHANYVRWMEEARINFFKLIGIDIDCFIQKKISLAVLSQSVEYKKYVIFGEKIEIKCSCIELTNTKISFKYEFYNVDNKHLCAKGYTTHCFVDEKLNPFILKKMFPIEYNLLKSNITLG